jgi:hypothetical protein
MARIRAHRERPLAWSHLRPNTVLTNRITDRGCLLNRPSRTLAPRSYTTPRGTIRQVNSSSLGRLQCLERQSTQKAAGAGMNNGPEEKRRIIRIFVLWAVWAAAIIVAYWTLLP